MFSLQPGPIYTAFIMLLVANGAPIIAHRLLGGRYSQPVDLGRLWRDGRPILGPTKTWRGVVSAVGATALVGTLLGFPSALAAAFGALSMLGDLASSFLKRRMGVKSSVSVFGLDQMPEALLPTICLAGPLGLDLWGVVVASLGFLVLGAGLSGILNWSHIRKRPL